jgi:hypothetical protein
MREEMEKLRAATQQSSDRVATMEDAPAESVDRNFRNRSEDDTTEVLIAIPDPWTERNELAIEVPRLGSFIASGTWDAREIGLDTFPPQDRPPVIIPFFTFRFMVGMGLIMLAVSWLGLLLRWRGRPESAHWFLWPALLAFPTGFIADRGQRTIVAIMERRQRDCGRQTVAGSRCRRQAAGKICRRFIGSTRPRELSVAQIGRIKLSGFPAWMLWSLVHIYFLIGFRKRLLVAASWLWSYLTFQRGARLITGISWSRIETWTETRKRTAPAHILCHPDRAR